tara:strand:- start:1748 stop:3076 length:1329 start_codon:yes stop_codon:yes gene_type:complete
MVNGGKTIGSLTAEGVEFDEYNRSELDRKFTFKGTGIEKTRNMFSYFALTGKPAPDGVTYTTDVYSGDKGENMLKAEITFDPKSQSFLDLSPTDQEKIKENGYKLNFDQDWGKWKEDGFLTQVEQGLSKEVLNESIKFEVDGNLIKGMSTPEYITKSATSADGKTETNQINETILNTPWLEGESKMLTQAKAETIISMSPQEQNDYIAYTLEQKGGDFDRSTTIIEGTQEIDEFGKIKKGTGLTLDQLLKDQKKAVNVLTKLAQNQFNEDTFGGEYLYKAATPAQAARLNKLNKDNPRAAEVKAGEMIYLKETEKTIQTDTPASSTVFNPKQGAINVYNEIARDPLSAYNRYNQGPGAKATLIEGSIISVPQEDGDPVRYNMDVKEDRAIFFQEVLDGSNMVGNDDKGRKIRMEFPKLVDSMSDQWLKEKSKKNKAKLPIKK